MQVSVETAEGLKRRLTIDLPAENIDSAIQERLRKLSRTARINGFRPGKIPLQVVRKRFEPQVRSEVLGDLINSSYIDAIKQEKLKPAGNPQIEPARDDSGDGGNGFSYIATIEVFPEFEPVFNDSIKVVRPAAEVSEPDIDEMIESLLKQRTEYALVERASADADQIVIDFTGRLDGEEFEGGKADKAPLVLGSGSMVDGFESQLVGLSAGDERTIQVTFPAEYQAGHLAGKPVEFDIVVHEVREARKPELDEALIKSLGIEQGTVEALRTDIRANMERELRQRIESQVKTQVMDGLVALNPIEVPAALVNEEIALQREQMKEKLPAEADSPMLADELFAEQATRRVRLGLVVSEIVQKHGLKADATAVRERLEVLADSYQDAQQVIDYYYSNPELLRNIEGLVLEDIVTDTVLAAADITDDHLSFKDIMNPPAPDSPGAQPDTNTGND